MSANYKKLRVLLQELFQLDQADLDFGIYRIMNQKREEIVRFLDDDLLPQVKEAFGHYQSADRAEIQKELDKLVQNITNAGMNPDDSPKVKELKEKLAENVVDVTALENEVFSHLFNFFRRYYSEGDFISLRRYKEGVYAIPYEGEEIKLHWANADQYYIKSSEHFDDYIFMMESGKRVRVHIVAASTEQDNKIEAAGKERRFVLCSEDPLYEQNGELFIRFEYRTDDGKKKQDVLNKESVDRVLASQGFDGWIHELRKPSPTEKQPNRTVLEKHLAKYTDRNTFDYFIHKDLGGFLRRELDFFVKNEVMHLDDIEHESAPKVEQYLSQIKVIRKIAGKIIQFLDQLETFQKKLWLKKKFVVETHYCVTLDRVPEALYPEIVANEAQREEWVRLFAINDIKKTLASPGYSEPLTVAFLKAMPFLMVDTRHFTQQFTDRLRSGVGEFVLDAGSLLVQSDNFHALSLIDRRFAGSVESIYIDSPYNTSASKILYKNDYEHSSWLSLIDSRLRLARHILAPNGIICVTIDDFELHNLRFALSQVFGPNSHLGTVAIRNNPQGRSTAKGFRVSHEYAVFYTGGGDEAGVGRLERTEEQGARWDQVDDEGKPYLWENFRKTGTGSQKADRPKQYFPLYFNGQTLRVPAMTWDELSEEWIVTEKPLASEKAFWPHDSNGAKRVWKWGLKSVIDYPTHLKVEPPNDGDAQVYCRNYRNEDGRLPSTWWDDAKYAAGSHGTNFLTGMFGSGRVFDFPKSVYAVEDCVKVTGLQPGSFVVDFFGGSGTTANAVINLNRKKEASEPERHFILVEVGDHFEKVLLPRVKKSIFASEWKDGKPENQAGVSSVFKCIRLESYEEALSNLELKRTQQQERVLFADPEVREQFVLSYMLDVESRGSQSLLNVEGFRNPDQYKLKVERNGETQLVNVDLVETFNWLLGLTVKHLDLIRGIRVVEGTNPDGERVLVLWRNLDDADNNKLDDWFEKQGYSTRDLEYDLVYVNGDNNLENLRRNDQTWKVRLIEDEFQRLMFDVEDV